MRNRKRHIFYISKITFHLLWMRCDCNNVKESDRIAADLSFIEFDNDCLTLMTLLLLYNATLLGLIACIA